nr:MAG TPA: hypothetical protein [Caudoviricetes sp.]
MPVIELIATQGLDFVSLRQYIEPVPLVLLAFVVLFFTSCNLPQYGQNLKSSSNVLLHLRFMHFFITKHLCSP